MSINLRGFTENTEFFSRYWKNRKINWEVSYFNIDHPHRKFLVSMLKENPVKSVLEIGCGAGANLFNIKKEFPETKVAGCDINEDAIETAKQIFVKNKDLWEKKGRKIVNYEEHPIQKEQRETFGKEFVRGLDMNLEEVELKAGSATDLPFHGESFDLVLTDAFLIYIGPDKIERVIREMRRVGYNKFIFIEFHSFKWLERFYMGKTRKNDRYYVYDYAKLLSKYYFKNITITKITQEIWPTQLWCDYGHIITCIR